MVFLVSTRMKNFRQSDAEIRIGLKTGSCMGSDGFVGDGP
jgi:hypothetical protein